MKKLKKLGLLGCIVIAMLAFGGCSTGSAPEPKNTEELMARSAEAMKEVESLTADTAMTMSMNIMDQDVDIAMKGNLREIIAEELVEMNMTMTMGSIMGMPGEEMTMQMYGKANPDKKGEYITYAYTDGEWIKATVDATEYQESTTDMSDAVMKVLEENKDSITMAEEKETVDGKEMYVIEGTIPSAALNELMSTTSTGEDSASLIPEGMDMALKGYYDAETKLPHKINLNMAETEIEQSGMTMKMGMVMDVLYTGFNNVDSIEIPEEALNAKEVEMPEATE